MNVKRVLCWSVSIVILATSTLVYAQQYPTRPVRLIVPFAPGGSTDIMGRLIGQHLAETLGQQFVVDNRGGAGTKIGTEIAAKAAPDGYTLLLTNVAFAILPGLHGKRLPYDAQRDFVPMTLIASQPTVLAAHPSFTARSVAELIRLAREKPGQFSFASSGIGGIGHIAGEMFKLMAGVDLVHVPYKGGGPAVVDLMAGQVQLGFVGMPTSMAHAKAGRLRLIAVTDGKRAPAAPEVPTVAEGGLKGYQAENWIGMMAPAGTSKAIIARVHDVLIRILQKPEVKTRLESSGFNVVGLSPGEFKALIERDIKAFAGVIEKANIRVN